MQKESEVAFDVVDSSGWFLKCELLASGSTAKGLSLWAVLCVFNEGGVYECIASCVYGV